ncbi:nitroreductase family deazaflavin-dependent oxidoreductase [Pedococcus sp.]|jgi:deazaflavin-dependent oxidoreductase (nitroreductase family)|uniref:nitroreductase family deazaflavin-dependent oxidoreductase n=1 Tax=Pedococcus sp. TaxID=2860345 RepID=UPI002E0E2E34|nr:nitroreductase family deazaflavin-dependent oxidoreductase [Pedococcus sp.]
MSDWNDGVIREFRANGGKVGGYFEGAPMILLHHVGAKSGTTRVSPLVYFPQADGTMLVVASKGGAPSNPDWYYNLKAHPRFEVEVGTETFPVEARELTPEERAEVWPGIVAERPGFGDYETKTTRVMPVFRLSRVS